jgi:CBS domain containing-hemolysin-like protein
VIKGVSFFVAFFVISYLHIVVGELAPKSWAIRKPELLSLWTAVPLYLFYWAMYPAIYLLNASANAILRIAGQGEPGPHHEHHYSREELKLILHSSRGQDPSDQGMRVLASAVEMGELEVVDWANSREDLVTLDFNAPLKEILALFRRHKFSRYPVYDASARVRRPAAHQGPAAGAGGTGPHSRVVQPGRAARPLERVSRHMPLSQLLEQFRKAARTSPGEEADGKVIGYLTMEDVLEVLVGDIQDEHRKAERGILAYQPGKLLVRGDTPLFKVERLLGIDLDHIEAETLAGLIYETLKRVPEEEEVLEVEGLRIIIKKMKGPKIVLAKVLMLD